MSSNIEKFERRAITDWHALSMRLTVFTAMVVQRAEIDKWWERVSGEQPESLKESPKIGTVEIEGPFGSRYLGLSVTVGRIDWNLTVLPTEEPGSAKLSEFFQLFEGPMAKWLEEMPKVMRLALGVIAVLPIADRTTGYMQLGAYLPNVKLDPQTMQDFLYQVNRRRQSIAVENLTVNRLSKWSVGHFGRPRLSLQFPGAPAALVIDGENSACISDLDINSAPDRPDPFEGKDLPRLWKEFVGLAYELVENGDVI